MLSNTQKTLKRIFSSYYISIHHLNIRLIIIPPLHASHMTYRTPDTTHRTPHHYTAQNHTRHTAYHTRRTAPGTHRTAHTTYTSHHTLHYSSPHHISSPARHYQLPSLQKKMPRYSRQPGQSRMISSFAHSTMISVQSLLDVFRPGRTAGHLDVPNSLYRVARRCTPCETNYLFSANKAARFS